MLLEYRYNCNIPASFNVSIKPHDNDWPFARTKKNIFPYMELIESAIIDFLF